MVREPLNTGENCTVVDGNAMITSNSSHAEGASTTRLASRYPQRD